MEKNRITQEDAKLAEILRKEILKNSETIAQPKQREVLELEYISKTEQPYISPIMTMNEDEILNFVEEFQIEELATLTDAELNRINEVLNEAAKNS